MKVISHPEKEAIIQNFGRSASSYESAATVQQESAQRLAKSLEPWIDIVPPGPVLELGAGTGLLTRQLLPLLKGREAWVTDISEAMLKQIPKSVKQSAQELLSEVNWKVQDGEFLEEPEQPWSFITHNFLAQWFKDPAYSMQRMVECLAPGGLMLAAFPGHQSFPQWQEACEQAGVPYTGNEMPNTEEMVIKLSTGPCEVDFYEDEIRRSYPDPMSFFKSLRQLGAHTCTGEELSLSIGQLRRLCDTWRAQAGENQDIPISYHTVFLAVKKHA
ncbi:MAG: methyltransferase [Bacteroidota bacterium]